jgi:hypothetical protein
LEYGAALVNDAMESECNRGSFGTDHGAAQVLQAAVLHRHAVYCHANVAELDGPVPPSAAPLNNVAHNKQRVFFEEKKANT